MDTSNPLAAMSPAKRFWWSIGRSALFVGIFVWFQSQLSTVISAVIAFTSGGKLTEEELLASVMSWASMISAVGGILTIITVLLILYVRDFSPADELALVPPTHRRTLWQAALIGVGACGVVSLLLSTIPFPESWMDSYMSNSEAITGGNPILDILATVVIAPLCEEIVFRGLVYRGLKRGMPTVAAALITSAVFGILHGTIVWFVYTFLLSLVLITMYEYAKSLWAPILTHTAFNIVGQLPLLFEDAPLWVSSVYVYACLAVFGGTLAWILIRRKRAQNPQIPA